MGTSKKENAVIERLNVNMDSDNDGDGHDSDEEGGPGTKEVKQVLSYAEHQKIKLDRLFEKCKDGRAVFIPEMGSKIPERDVNQVRETQYNIMGSCAGAGSGEFHSFRKSRRREYARQSILKYRDIRDKKNVEVKKDTTSEESEESDEEEEKTEEEKEKTPAEGEEKVEEKDEIVQDPLMQHNTAPPLVIAGQFSVE